MKKTAQIQVEQISNLPSPDLTSEIWVRRAGSVNQLQPKPEITGIVVTHGDTLEETASALAIHPRATVGTIRPARVNSSWQSCFTSGHRNQQLSAPTVR